MNDISGLPRPYRGQAWIPIVEGSGSVKAAHRLSTLALVELESVPGGDERLLPQLTREQVGDLIGQLDGTCSASAGRDRHADVARISWAGDGVGLVVANRAGTDHERIDHVEPDERGLYKITLDRVLWLPEQPLTGEHRYEWALSRLGRARIEQQPRAATVELTQVAMAAVGQLLADVLATAGPEPADVVDLLGVVVSAAMRQLFRDGSSDTSFHLAHAVMMRSELLHGPVMQELRTAAQQRQQRAIAEHCISCAVCGRTTRFIVACPQPAGFVCPLCLNRPGQVQP